MSGRTPRDIGLRRAGDAQSAILNMYDRWVRAQRSRTWTCVRRDGELFLVRGPAYFARRLDEGLSPPAEAEKREDCLVLRGFSPEELAIKAAAAKAAKGWRKALDARLERERLEGGFA